MIFLFALGAGLISFLFMYFLFATKIAPQAHQKQREKIMRYTSTGTSNEKDKKLEDIPFSERVIYPLFNLLSHRINRFAPSSIFAVFRKRIIYAGKQNEWNANIFVSLWLIFIAGGGLGGFLLSFSLLMPFIHSLGLILLGSFIGGLLPLAYLDSLIRRRRSQMMHDLPSILDLLCVSVQAGLSFDAALANITQRMKGPFIEECTRMLRDVRMGMTHRIALQNLAERCNMQEIYLFTTAIIQSEKLGVSMSNTLSIQADNMRERRRQYVKAQAMKAPVKIIFPLVIFIFPAIFIVTLMPAILSIIKAFQHGL